MSTRSVVEEELFTNGLYSAISDAAFARPETDENFNSPQAPWVCCSRNRSIYWGIDDSAGICRSYLSIFFFSSKAATLGGLGKRKLF